jgi:hypothetical protein
LPDFKLSHLHIGGSTFELRGDKAVVNALVRDVRKSNMLSAGRRPGFA